MDIDELLKQQSTWVERAQDVALQITRRRGTTPEEAGLEALRIVAEIEDRIRTLEARREATVRAFDTAIETEKRTLAELVRPTTRPVAKPAQRKPAGKSPAGRRAGKK